MKGVIEYVDEEVLGKPVRFGADLALLENIFNCQGMEIKLERKCAENVPRYTLVPSYETVYYSSVGILTVTSIQRTSPGCWRGVLSRNRRKEWLSNLWMFTFAEE